MTKADDQFVDIDLDALDEEWVNQPKLFFRWAKKLADARLALDEKEANLKLQEAELDAAIRAKPKKYGINAERVTEAAIKAAIPFQVEFTEAQQKVYHAKHKVAVLQAGVTALDHKKKALENLVSLHGMNYFASPKADERNREAMEDIEERASRRKYRKKK